MTTTVITTGARVGTTAVAGGGGEVGVAMSTTGVGVVVAVTAIGLVGLVVPTSGIWVGTGVDDAPSHEMVTDSPAISNAVAPINRCGKRI